MGKDLYKILEISPTASQSEIKKAYKRLAKILHPDAHRGALEYEEKFKKLSNAYQVLKNPTSRRSYDSTHFNNFSQSNGKSGEESPRKNKKNSSEYWTGGRSEAQKPASSGKREEYRGNPGSDNAEPHEESKEQKIYREPWGCFEPITILKSIVGLTFISMFAIGVKHSSSQFAKPRSSNVSGQDVRSDSEAKANARTSVNSSRVSKHLQKSPVKSPVERSAYDANSVLDDSLSENTVSEVGSSDEDVTGKTISSGQVKSLRAEELALFDEMIKCVQLGNYIDCYDLATSATETFIDRSRLGTAYFVQFISAYNIEKSDASLDLFFVMLDLQSQNQIHVDPLYEAQAFRSALHLTVILNDRANYNALRDPAITHTEAYSEYAEQVDDIIKSADVKIWPTP